jgi:hypothetical protein
MLVAGESGIDLWEACVVRWCGVIGCCGGGELGDIGVVMVGGWRLNLCGLWGVGVWGEELALRG